MKISQKSIHFYFLKRSSLLFLTKQKIKEEDISLYNSRHNMFKQLWKEKLTDYKSWRYILFLIIIAWSLCFIGIDFNLFGYLKFKDVSTLSVIIDQRISNIAAITSITLVVVGFLITNLAAKNKESIDLLFRKTKLYPIIYLILSTISILLIVSFLRDSLNPLQFKNSIFMGICLMLTILIFIGYLFSKLIRVTNPQYLYSLFSEDLYIKAKHLIYNEKVENYSKKILYEKFKKYGKILKSSYQAKNTNHYRIIPKKPSIIKDMNLNNIENCLKNIHQYPNLSNELEFHPIHLNQYLSENQPKQIISFSNIVRQKQSIESYINDNILVEEISDRNHLFFEGKENLLEKIKMHASSNDLKFLKMTLDNYDELYRLYFEHFETFEKK